MARKSIKGYAEKNYYDNTRFSGGIVATNDPLNEGYFKHMVNFDISDTGASVEPRKGFFTTTFKINDAIYTLSNETIYFYNASLGTNLFIDFKQYGYTKYDDNNVLIDFCPLIVSANFDIDNRYLTDANLIIKFDYSKLKTDLNITDYSNIIFLQDKAELAIDKYGISRYIIKAEYTVEDKVTPIWVSFVYRKNGSVYEGVTYEADTLVMEYLDFSDIGSINMADRNIASGQSIIPDPIQYIHTSGDLPLDFVQQFPLIYVKDSEGKYLINTTKKLEGLEFIPYFQLDKSREGYDWYYTYDIVSTDPGAGLLGSENKFKSGIFNLKTGASVTGLYTNDKNDEDSTWFHVYKKIINNIPIYADQHNNNTDNISITYDDALLYYNQYLKDLDIINTKPSLKNNISTIIYVMPKPTSQNIYTINDMNKFNGMFDNTYGASQFANGTYVGDFVYKYNATSNILDDYFNPNVSNDFYIHKKLYDTYSNTTIDDFLMYLQLSINVDEYLYYVVNTNELVDYYYAISEGFQRISQTAINSRICVFSDKEVFDFSTLKQVLRNNSNNSFIIKPFTTNLYIDIQKSCFNEFSDDIKKMLSNFQNDYINKDNSYVESLKYYLCTDLKFIEFNLIPRVNSSNENYTSFTNYRSKLFRNRIFKEFFNVNKTDKFVLTYYPLIQKEWITLYSTYVYLDNILSYSTLDESLQILDIFEKIGDESSPIICIPYKSNKPNELHKYLINNGYFKSGININLYLFQAPIFSDESINYYYDREYLINSTPLKSNRQIILSTIEPTTMIEKLTEEPELIANANNSLLFRSTQGDHLVVYSNNKVFISEANTQYYFKYDKMFEYPETVVKVIQYKDTLLVFTTQNLYSIYPIEVTENVQSGTDEEGNATYTQVTTIAYGNLPVLYNLLVNEKYKDAIQVYNQMVLFYSADGQMFMIKPTATIDSNTRFSIQYFNKNANDILLNYNYYMQERLKYYRYDDLIIDKDKVNIKVSVSLNYIKIFYCSPGIMTYILVYDIINNRYYTYDTLSFTDIKQLEFVPDGELYIVEYNNQLYFTQPYVVPNEVNSNVDRAFYNNFTAESIHSELDTGILNLNNHLKKRFKDLHIIYKNLDAQNIEFALDVFVDNVPISLAINTEIEIKNVGIIPTYNPSDIYSVTQLINKSKVELMSNNNALFDFSEFNSSKILTHKVSIISRGKHIRNKLCFKSEGKFKIQGYGLIYKEHTV